MLSLDPSAYPQPNFETNQAIRALASGQWNVRMLSTSLALPYLAAGRLASAVYASTAVLVHFAAGLLVAEEAGARITDADRAAWDLDSHVYVVRRFKHAPTMNSCSWQTGRAFSVGW